jgi:acyl-CoA synthetase (AMP-forming)/AMP-acid ligase II
VNLETIFRHAHCNPERVAIYDRGHRISYGEFAFWIAEARQFLERQDLRDGSVAALVEIKCRTDGWAFAFALRSLGLTTISVGSPEVLNELGLRNLGCVITASRDDPLGIASADEFKLIRIPEVLFLNRTTGPVPELPALIYSDGGHIRLTSGTTGTSKKVLLDPWVIAAESRRRGDYWSISPDSVVNVFGFALWTGLGFYGPCTAWTAGASVVFHQVPKTLRSSLDVSTHAFTTPQTVLDLLHSPAIETRRNEEMRLFVAGGALPHSVYSAARATLTPRIFTAISSTEVGPWALTPIGGSEDLASHIVHPSMEVQVVDDADKPLPAGQIGAVRVRINGITGYLDDPEASAAFFRDGYFYSGDLGKFRLDGRLVLCGRNSNVINIHGNKWIAETIEQALLNRLAVEGVCVFSAPGENGDEELHIGIESQRPIGRDEITAAVNAEFNRPERAVVHLLNPMPRNDLGKIDRAALRRLCANSARSSPER